MTCADLREIAPELALGVLGGAERAEALLHANACASCRRFVAELTETVDVLAQAAPEADPPAGFETAVARHMNGDRRRTARRWAVSVAAVAAAAAIVSVATVRVVQGTDDSARQAAAPVRELRSGAMVGGGGHVVGRVFAYRGNPSWVSVTVGYRVPTGEYQVQLVGADGQVDDAGTVYIIDGKGAWGGAIGRPLDALHAVRMVDAHGAVVCSATLGST